MALPTPTGILNHLNSTVEPQNTGDWTDLGTTWADSDTWNPTATSFVWISELVELSSVQTVNMVVEAQAQGTVAYDVYASDTGAFAGEETVTSIAQGDTGVDSFSGRWFFVVATVTNNTALPILEKFTTSTQVNKSTKLKLADVDTSALTGTVDARELDFGRTTSGIRNIQITVKEVTDFTLESYATDYPTSNTLIPRIVNKTAATIALVGLDNVPRDGVIDVVAEVLPEQYMDGNNLRVR
jgi:hypothetical protein